MKKINGEIAKTSPVQRQFDHDFIFNCLTYLQTIFAEGFGIVELGCHDGSMASAFSEVNVEEWVGYDIINVVNQIRQANRRFRFVELDGQIWDRPSMEFRGKEVFISSHTIEHLSDVEVDRLIPFMRMFKYLMLIVHASEDGDDWMNYDGLHVYTAGVGHIRESLTGFQTLIDMRDCYGSWLYFGKRLRV